MMRVDILAERVRQAMLTRNDKSLFVRGDGSVAYQDLMSVIDKLKEAGIEKVGLVTRPAGEPLIVDAVTEVLLDRSREADRLIAHGRAVADCARAC